jgi:hypothetical protein
MAWIRGPPRGSKAVCKVPKKYHHPVTGIRGARQRFPDLQILSFPGFSCSFLLTNNERSLYY